MKESASKVCCSNNEAIHVESVLQTMLCVSMVFHDQQVEFPSL